ncbi:MAG: dihydroorotase [Acidimicrobiia bacterium]
MTDFDLAVKGATLVASSGVRRTNVYVKDGRVALVDDGVHRSFESVDASGLLVLPGMVDTHVHLMDPGDPTREDFPTGTAAAAANGVTTIIEHTHGSPVRTVDDLRNKLDHLQGRARVDFGLAAHVWPGQLRDLAALWSAGVAFFKVFTCTTHGVPATEGSALAAVLAEVARFGGNCLIHCEDESITREAETSLRLAGRTDPGVVIEWRNRSAEEAAVGAVAILARQTGARVTVAHVSTRAIAGIVSAAVSSGADIVAEACPQYFLLREDEILAEGALRKFTPPARIRSDEEEEAMWDLLREGGFNHISTDHAPSTLAQKSAGGIWDVHFGLPGLDTTLRILLDAAAAGRLTYEQVVRLYSEAPARRYGLYPRKGHLGIGADADLLLVDPGKEWTIENQMIISKAGWSPYAGRRGRGTVEATYLRGTEVARGGVPVDVFNGRFVPGEGVG